MNDQFQPVPFVADAQTAMAALDACVQELRWLSRKLAEVENELSPRDGSIGVEAQYQRFVDDFEVGLWKRSEDEDDFKLPAEKLRLKLAHAAMEPALFGRYVGLVNGRKRLEKRIATLVKEIDAQRSILSALKEEAAAVGSGFGRRAA